MSPSTYFSASYAEARGKFREAAQHAGARLAQYVNPTKGPNGEELTTDVAILGPKDAARVLITVSATHGAEGFCGSGVQVGSFESGIAGELPPGTALLAIHAINPHGFAWVRRVTEENVDLNRNFVDHTKPLPSNLGYEALHEAICPQEWNAASQSATRARFDEFREREGAAAFQRAISGGQYGHSDSSPILPTVPPSAAPSNGTAPSPTRRLAIRARPSCTATISTGWRRHWPGATSPSPAWRSNTARSPSARYSTRCAPTTGCIITARSTARRAAR